MLRRLYSSQGIFSNCNILINRLFSSHRSRNNNSNIEEEKQLKSLKEFAEYCDDTEGFGDLETDFKNVGLSHRQYEKEQAKYRKKVALWIVKNKYFKEYNPNFLTYAEKEKIRSLHNHDSEEWTAEKLSESFPATPDIIAKILKSKWTPTTTKRISQHDEAVMRNWQLYKKGKLANLNDDIKAHIDKFTKRDRVEVNNTKAILKIPSILPKTNEFSKIITSIKTSNKSDKTLTLADNFLSETQIESTKFYRKPKINLEKNDSYLLAKVRGKKYVRLKDIQQTKGLLKLEHNQLGSGKSI